MTRAIATLALLLGAVGLATSRAGAQSRALVAPEAVAIYQRLLPRIARIRIFDHHAHPGFPDDPEIDPAPVPEGALPLRLTPGNPDWAAADRALFGVTSKVQLKKLNPGAKYFDAILDTLGIETSLANRITMSGDLDPARFRWVFYIDPVLFPFDNSALAARNTDQAAFMPNQTKLILRFRQQAGLTALPSDLAGYLAFVTRVLEDHQHRGAVAAKFEIAYFRSFVFDDPPRASVEAIYANYRQGGTPSAAEYKAFQDLVFRHVLTECGRLHLPVHIHSAAGAGDYFSIAGASVLNLEPVLRDPRYLSTTFVLIHGGYPFDQQAILIALMKNVWIDSSATGSFLMYPNQFKDVLKRWFEINPGKVTFGSDAFPINEHIGAEELYWFGVHNARVAAAAALAEMVAAREITEPQAMTIAHGYLHDNAAALYR
ncbi:MAG: amidohydrolase family protein [Vicinamibacterales bacterium]